MGSGDTRGRDRGASGIAFRPAAARGGVDTPSQYRSLCMSYETVLVETHGAVTLVRLNRPQALNALNTQVLADLIDVFAKYDADPAQRCLVLTGSEKAFAAGADIKEMSEKAAADFFLEDFFAGWTSGVTATRKPWIAAVAGFALG